LPQKSSSSSSAFFFMLALRSRLTHGLLAPWDAAAALAPNFADDTPSGTLTSPSAVMLFMASFARTSSTESVSLGRQFISSGMSLPMHLSRLRRAKRKEGGS
jgi:hypothetical protein